MVADRLLADPDALIEDGVDTVDLAGVFVRSFLVSVVLDPVVVLAVVELSAAVVAVVSLEQPAKNKPKTGRNRYPGYISDKKFKKQIKEEKDAKKKKIQDEKEQQEKNTYTGVKGDFPPAEHQTSGQRKTRIEEMKVPKHIKGFGAQRFGRTAFKTLIAGSTMALVGWYLLPIVADMVSMVGFAKQLILLLIVGGISASIYLILAYLLKIDELRWMLGLMKQKLTGS